MTREEFQALAEAYGGELARWPTATREEAALLVASDPEFARAVLAPESWLDGVLDELPRVQATSALFEQVVASAPPVRRTRRWRLWLAPAGLGAAMAGVAAAGVLLGVQLGQQASVKSATTAEASATRATADLDVTGLAEEG